MKKICVMLTTYSSASVHTFIHYCRSLLLPDKAVSIPSAISGLFHPRGLGLANFSTACLRIFKMSFTRLPEIVAPEDGFKNARRLDTVLLLRGE